MDFLLPDWLLAFVEATIGTYEPEKYLTDLTICKISAMDYPLDAGTRVYTSLKSVYYITVCVSHRV